MCLILIISIVKDTPLLLSHFENIETKYNHFFLSLFSDISKSFLYLMEQLITQEVR